jgi:hypothetical protein
MIKKMFLVLLLYVGLLQPLISQVEYTVTIRGNELYGYPSCLLADNEFVFLAYNMRDFDYIRNYTGIVKIDATGVIVDSLMFLPQSDTITHVWNIQKTSQAGIYSGCGIKRYQNEEFFVWLFEFNAQMQILWERIIDAQNNFFLDRMQHQVIGENRYVLCTGEKTLLYNFNKITGNVIKNDSYRGGVYYLCPIPPENNTFLINDPHNPLKIIVLDSAFEMITDAIISTESGGILPDCEFINNSQFVVVRRKLSEQKSLIMKKTDISSMDILATKQFGYEDFERGIGMLGVHKAIALQEGYFFVFGASALQLAPEPVVKFANNLQFRTKRLVHPRRMSIPYAVPAVASTVMAFKVRLSVLPNKITAFTEDRITALSG